MATEEGFRIDRILKIKINFQEFKADMEKTQSEMMEFVHHVEE